jgi:predicted RNase H-like nuclease (RuvC/YqgF family)
MLDTDIDFMDFDSARQYVLAFITTLKETQKERGVTEEELALWQRRVKLAAGRGEQVLQKAAEEKVAELAAKQSRLLAEEAELARKTDVLKEKLRRLRIRSTLTVDADALLAQLSMLAGEPDTLKRDLQQQEAQSALEELKRKMNRGGEG